ncbi:hypothetical protein [Flectobacillus roseus]|jgi:hypothetical protein|uniref:hypothetical protein n=1 Tax=Flectobacillus roseus TaxID=502259 RepID=UPI001412292F|nr:hypothetical protein [Flectobacillus roseus]MDI9867901.1 hypothetical protein [Flectobacillus roseus]NBA74004.1 hypothetical protein [Emticicia sp. ODNR4P]
MKPINSTLLLGIFLFVTYSSCERANTIPQENEKVIEVQTGKETTIRFNDNTYVFTLKSVDDARVPDCNLHYGSLLPAKLSIEVNKQTYNYEFFSCKLDEEFSWTELNNRPESIKETKTINDHTEFRVSKVSTTNQKDLGASIRIIVRNK